MRNALTASERRGILVVGGIALLVTGFGWGVSMCRSDVPEETFTEVEVLVRGDAPTATDSTDTAKKRNRKNKNDSVRRKRVKTPKRYRRRNPMEEEVSAK